MGVSSINERSRMLTTPMTYRLGNTGGLCFICGEYGNWVIAPHDDKLWSREWVCEKHKIEYLNGDTDWWELTRLVTEATDAQVL